MILPLLVVLLCRVPLVLDDDGGWCWFQDERCIVHDEVLYVGTVSSGYVDTDRMGDINVIVHHLETGETSTAELHDQLELDDHDVPALLSTESGVFAMWPTHGGDWKTHYRTIQLYESLSELLTFSPESRDGYGVTYSNTFHRAK